jgi:hypothetical protein
MAATSSLFFIDETPARPMSWATFRSSGMSIADSSRGGRLPPV